MVQKKKCDEARPKCSRCEEHGHECIYEPVKPRQRRKRDSIATLSLNTNNIYSCDDSTDEAAETPRSGIEEWYRPRADDDLSAAAGYGSQLVPLSVKNMDSTLDGMFPWSSVGLTAISPREPGQYDFPDIGGPPLQEDDDVEEIIRTDPINYSNTTINTTSNNHKYSSLALATTIPAPSPNLEFRAPVFADFSERPNRRALVDHFCNVLSHLIVFREENGNPFQQLVLPLSHGSPAVMDAIYALASAHLEFRGVENGEKSVWFHNQAIQGLARLIEQGGGVNKNELLAAIMLLVYYEVVSDGALLSCSM